MKRCSQCKRRKPLREFYFVGEPCGRYRRGDCRACVNERLRRQTERSKEWLRDHCRAWFHKHRRLLASANAVVTPKLSPYYRLQHEAIMAYGGYCCTCCGIDEPFFLTIDHVDGNGGKQRRKTGTGTPFYSWLRDHSYPPGFQVLCSNCNHGRYRNGGTCPHEYRVKRCAEKRKQRVSRVRAPRGG